MKFGGKIKDKPFGENYGSGDYLRTFKEGPTLVRFIDQLDDWHGYFEHYHPSLKRSVPCLRDEDGNTDECEACNSDNKAFKYASRKVALNLCLVDKDIVLPFKISATLHEKLERRAEKDGGDITKRDYLITRTGMDQKTDYDVDREDAYEANFKELRSKSADINEILEDNFKEFWSEYGDKIRGSKSDDDDEPRSRRRDEEDEKPPF